MHPISPRETLPLTRMIAATLFTIVSRFELCTAVLASLIHSSLSRGLDRKRRVRVRRNERWYQIGSRQVHGGLLRVYHHAQQLPQGARRGQLDGLVDAGGLSTGHGGTIYAMSVRHGGGGDGVRANSCTSGFMIEVHGDIFCARILLLLLFFCSLLFLVQPAKPLRGWRWGVCVAKSHACEVCECVWITACCYTYMYPDVQSTRKRCSKVLQVRSGIVGCVRFDELRASNGRRREVNAELKPDASVWLTSLDGMHACQFRGPKCLRLRHLFRTHVGPYTSYLLPDM